MNLKCARCIVFALLLGLGCSQSGPGVASSLPVDDAGTQGGTPVPEADAAPARDAASLPPDEIDYDAALPPVVSEPDCPHPHVEAQCAAGFCRIPAGCFVMGSPESEWGHPAYAEEQVKVTLTHAFEMQQHEVKQREWTALGLPNPSGKFEDGTGDCDEPDCPVGKVTWSEAAAYANLLSERHQPPLQPCYELSGCQRELGRGLGCSGYRTTAATLYACEGYRLPTDAEREYAARAGTRTAFYVGDIRERDTDDCLPDPLLSRIAWYCINAGGQTHPVEQKEANGWGLFDMAGNALEWVNDGYRGIPSAGGRDPGGVLSTRPSSRIVRGGVFHGPAKYCRAAWQGSASVGTGGPGLGFRLVRTLHDDLTTERPKRRSR